MGKVFIIFLLIMMSSFQSVFAASNECLKLNMSAHPNYPPFHWQNGDTLTGASIGISRKIFERLGVEVRVRYEGPWKRVLMSAKQGKIDFIPALKKTSEREKFLRFTDNTFSSNPVTIFVQQGAIKNVTSLDDLIGLFGSINAGDKHGDEVDSFVSSQQNMQIIHGLEQNFKMLKLGRIDYFITGYYTGYDYLKRNELDNDFEIALKIDGLEIHNGFSNSFAKKCPSILKDFDKQLSIFKQKDKVQEAISQFHDLWLLGSIDSR